MKLPALIAGSCLLLTACASRDIATRPGPGSPPESGELKEVRARWETPIPVGMTEWDFRAWIQADRWAAGWMGPPRTLSAVEARNWAERRATFVGHIHREAGFQEAVARAATLRVYSCQGIPSTGYQFTVLCAEDGGGDWRVVYRAVRERSCF